jgi:hypothetical protein
VETAEGAEVEYAIAFELIESDRQQRRKTGVISVDAAGLVFDGRRFTQARNFDMSQVDSFIPCDRESKEEHRRDWPCRP